MSSEGLDVDAMRACASDTPMSERTLRNFVCHFLGSAPSDA